MIKAGQKAPDFKLVDKDKKEVTLSNFKGKNLVLFFFPMAWTGTCTKEMCTIQEDYRVYESLNAAVAGVSVDTLFALKRFGEDYKINFPLLSDFNKTAIRDYDIVIEDFNWGYKGVAKRATFVIDKDGIVRFAEVLDNAGDFPDMKGVREALNLLQKQTAL
jgi:peroxiredoxin